MINQMIIESLVEGLDVEEEVQDFDDAIELFEWYTGLPADMSKIEPLIRYSGIREPHIFFHYMVWTDSMSSGCLSVQP